MLYVPRPPAETLVVWQDNATTATTGRGLNWPSASTEIDAVTGGGGGRRFLKPGNLGNVVQLTAIINIITAPASPVTINLALREVSSGALIADCGAALTSASSGTTALAGIVYTRNTTLAPDTATSVALYLSGGDGALDVIVKNVTLIHEDWYG